MNSEYGERNLVKSQFFQLVAVFKGIHFHLKTKVIYK